MSLDFKYIVVLVVYLLGLSAEFSDFRHPGLRAPWSELSSTMGGQHAATRAHLHTRHKLKQVDVSTSTLQIKSV